jgi:hypothetical protein
MLRRLHDDPALLQNLFFTDEAHVYANGEINTQNFRLWSAENPHWFAEEDLHPVKVTVWIGISVRGIVGPFFWERDADFPNERGITARWYRQFLENQVIPELQTWDNFDEIVFQHDGAPPHWARIVRGVLNQEFPGKSSDDLLTIKHFRALDWPLSCSDCLASVFA